jgi:hypothetical protein
MGPGDPLPYTVGLKSELMTESTFTSSLRDLNSALLGPGDPGTHPWVWETQATYLGPGNQGYKSGSTRPTTRHNGPQI